MQRAEGGRRQIGADGWPAAQKRGKGVFCNVEGGSATGPALRFFSREIRRGGSKNFGQRTYLNSMTFGGNQAVLDVSEGGIKSPVTRRNARLRPAKQVIEGPFLAYFEGSGAHFWPVLRVQGPHFAPVLRVSLEAASGRKDWLSRKQSVCRARPWGRPTDDTMTLYTSAATGERPRSPRRTAAAARSATEPQAGPWPNASTDLRP